MKNMTQQIATILVVLLPACEDALNSESDQQISEIQAANDSGMSDGGTFVNEEAYPDVTKTNGYDETKSADGDQQHYIMNRNPNVFFESRKEIFEPNLFPEFGEKYQMQSDYENDWLTITGTSNRESPYIKLDNFDSDNTDWVFVNSGGNLYVRKSTSSGSGMEGERIAFRTSAAPKSAVDILGLENNGVGDKSGALRLYSDWNQMVLDGNEIDTWNGTTGTTLHLNHNSKAGVVMCRNGGNVGIGTNKVSGYRLSVEGKIRAREIVVDNSTWADYVFDDGYKLRSLKEVAEFISKEGHLPDVPSAETVATNGVQIGEMQATLLRKIEELTLYVIAQSREIERLKTKRGSR